MTFLFSLLPTAVVLGILITIHEFGHFIACRLTGVKVEKFSIGFGPEVLKWQSKETRYVISLFPFGGFVKPSGESVSELPNEVPQSGDYLAASISSRIFIVISGVLMNYFLAFVLFTTVYVMGRPVPGTTIGTFADDYPAKNSGLQTGDRILEINEKKAANWFELTRLLDRVKEDEIRLKVQRGNEAMSFTIIPKIIEDKDVFGEKVRIKKLGIAPSDKDFTTVKLGFVPAMKESGHTVFMLTVLTHKALFYLVQGKLSMKALSGPIGIISMTGSAARLGLSHLLQLTANLSVSLAVINLLPVPALDGGHLLFLLIEAVRRKPLSLKMQERATQVGFALLITLMVFILYNDLVNYDYLQRIKGFFVRP